MSDRNLSTVPRARSLAAVLFSSLLAACAGAPLTQDAGPQAAPEGGREPLRVEITAGRAGEPAYMRPHVTGIRVEIENAGGAPVRIAYDDLALVDDDGRLYSALPLFRLGDGPEDPAVAPGQTRVEPAFQASQFSVADAYAAIYPSLRAFDGPFDLDRQYNHYYHAQWASIPLPTQEMLSLGLPEGVLGPGGKLSGLLYFEYSGSDLPALQLRGDFANPFTGERLGTVTVDVN